MEFYRLVWILTISAGLCEWAHAHDCTSSEMIMCRDELDNLGKNGMHNNLIDDDDLDEMCKKQHEALQCVKTYAESCLPPAEQQILNVLTQGSDQFFYDFCSGASAMRKEYLRYSNCIKMISSELDNCAKEYEISQKQLYEQESDSKILKEKTCCIYFENLQCSSNVTSKACGEEAAEVIRKLQTLLGGTYLNGVCEPYEERYFNDCSPISKSSKSITQTNFLYLLPLVLYAVFHYLI